MLKQHRERQKKLLPLFSPELRATRMAFAKGLKDTFLIFTVVFWISICFLYGSGYDTTRHMKDGTTLFCNMDDSQWAASLSTMITSAFDSPEMLRLASPADCGSLAEVRDKVWRGDYWNAVVINEGFGQALDSALAGGEYTPGDAVTFYTEESRHYFKVAVATKSVQMALTSLEATFAQSVFKAAAANSSAAEVIGQANPRALVQPFSFTLDNIAPYHFDMSMYILSVTLSLCMVVGSFIPSNMWKSIEEPFFKQIHIYQLIILRLTINIVWAFIICLQATGIVFAFRGPSWSPTMGDFFAMFGLFLLNTFAFTFFIDCMQNWIHPRFLLGAYFTTLFVNIAGAMFGPELNNHFFRITYALPFYETGLMLRTLLTRGSYDKAKFAITINVLWSVLWWVLSTFLIARKARLVRSGKMLMANVPPPPQEKPETAGEAALPVEKIPESTVSTETIGSRESAYSSTSSGSRLGKRDNHRSDVSDIEIEDS
ncbi:hypothetical protein BX070DRAFT_230705 [Coemansia spiralis]|nr:hypothetical protein BX070DRAFT_230705 [Coemansia spiralis]